MYKYWNILSTAHHILLICDQFSPNYFNIVWTPQDTSDWTLSSESSSLWSVVSSWHFSNYVSYNYVAFSFRDTCLSKYSTPTVLPSAIVSNSSKSTFLVTVDVNWLLFLNVVVVRQDNIELMACHPFESGRGGNHFPDSCWLPILISAPPLRWVDIGG